MKERIYINLRFLLLILLISIFISLFIVNGPFWLLLSLIEWILFVYTLWIIYIRHLSKQKTKWNIPEFFKGFVIAIIILLPLLLSLVSYPIIMIPLTYIRAEANRAEMEELVFDITKNCTTNESKVMTLLNWFERESGNIKNIWGGKSLGPFKFLGYSPKDWIICVRTLDRKPALFVLTSRCGACEEHSILFREMATQARLETKLVLCKGIDHIWAEVNLSGNWIVVEPANVVHSRNMTGFNISREEFEQKHAKQTKNISYIYSEDIEGNIEDITELYTSLSYIDITTVDENFNPVPFADISVISYNRFKGGVNTGLSFKTDGNGKYHLSIGGGSVTLEAINSDFIPLFGEETRYFNDSEVYDLSIVMKRDLTKSMPLYLIIILVIFIIVILLYILRFKKKGGKTLVHKKIVIHEKIGISDKIVARGRTEMADIYIKEAGRRVEIAKKAFNLTLKSNDKERGDALWNEKQNSLYTIMFSVFALEAHINRIGHDMLPGEAWKKSKKTLRIRDKWLEFPKMISGKTFDIKSQLWLDFDNIVTLRNKLVHFKDYDFKEFVPHPCGQNVVGLYEIVNIENAELSFDTAIRMMEELKKLLK